jgi:hypothetical protein
VITRPPHPPTHPPTPLRYDQEEFGANSDSQHHNPFVGDDQMFAKREAAAQQRLTRRDGSVMSLAQVRRGCGGGCSGGP